MRSDQDTRTHILTNGKDMFQASRAYVLWRGHLCSTLQYHHSTIGTKKRVLARCENGIPRFATLEVMKI